MVQVIGGGVDRNNGGIKGAVNPSTFSWQQNRQVIAGGMTMKRKNLCIGGQA